MKKYWYKVVFLAVALGAFTACDDDNDDVTPPPPMTTTGAYVINTGNWNANNGSVQWYDVDTKKAGSDLFAAANGVGIGDAQDLCVYGSKVYIACTSSAKIEIVNRKSFKREATLNLANNTGEPINPRYLTATGGNVYFTLYDGTVSKIDTVSLKVTATAEVGDHPEALTAADGKLYVNISGYGSEDKIAVVNLASFAKTKDIKVLLNPYDVSFTGEDGKVYFISCGDFGKTIPSTLQCIDPATDQVESVCKASKAVMKGRKIYFIYADYYLDDDSKLIGVYDMDTKKTTEFVAFSTFQNPGFIAVDPISGDVFIGDQPNSALNDVYVYGSDGTSKGQFETGYYTTGMRFVTE
ncbi:MAG: hypothetical protein LUE99_05195 [Bacteroides sp.]|nr:hypothetical protein [Bacteroides sp.]